MRSFSTVVGIVVNSMVGMPPVKKERCRAA